MLPDNQTLKRLNGHDIVALELAGNRDKVDHFLETWGPTGRAAARRSLLMDQVWLFTYAVPAAIACADGESVLCAANPWRRAAAPLAWAALAAGACDAVENTALLRVVGGSPSRTLPRLAQGAASTKFALLVVALPYAIAVSATATIQQRRHRPARRELLHEEPK
jgi:hypothetical protein